MISQSSKLGNWTGTGTGTGHGAGDYVRNVATIEECVAAIAHWRDMNGHSPGTARLDGWILGAIGVSPDLATLMDLERVVLRSRNRGSRSTYAARIHSCFNALRRMGVITTTVDYGLARPKPPKSLPRPLTDAQVDRLLSTMTGDYLAIVKIALLTGARSMEINAMRGDDLTIGLHGPELLLHGKGGKDERVPAHPTVVQVIDSYDTDDRVWPRWNSPIRVSQEVGKRMRATLGELVEFHQLRHTFGTRLMTASGGNLLLVSSLMRHNSLQTTLTYVKLVDDLPRLAIDQLAG